MGDRVCGVGRSAKYRPEGASQGQCVTADPSDLSFLPDKLLSFPQFGVIRI
jgi:hypothetical protein